MSLNNLELPPSVIVSLYASSLVDMDAEKEKIQPTVPAQGPKIESPLPTLIKTTSKTEWKSLGNNGKSILLVVNHPHLTHLPDEELNFITNILVACKLSLEDVALVNIFNYGKVSYGDILSHFKSREIILFGIDPVVFGLPVSFPQFQIQQFSQCTFLYAPSLNELIVDKLLKSKLWVSLQRVFGLA